MTINRRSFLRGLGLAPVTAAVLPSAIPSVAGEASALIVDGTITSANIGTLTGDVTSIRGLDVDARVASADAATQLARLRFDQPSDDFGADELMARMATSFD